MEEIWKDVKGFEGIYQVSNLGNIKTLQRNIYRKGTDRLHYIQPEKILNPPLLPIGYKYMSMHNGGQKKVKSIHSLVAEAFIPNPENKRTINHKDGNKLNNRVDNLEWATDKENLNHALENGLSKRFSLIAYDENSFFSFKSVREALKYGYKQTSISEAVNKGRKYDGMYWKYVGESSKPSKFGSAHKQSQIEKMIK